MCQITPRKPLTAASWQVFSRLAACPNRQHKPVCVPWMPRNRKPVRAWQRVRSRPGTRLQLPSWRVFSRLTAHPNRQQEPVCMPWMPRTGSQVVPSSVSDHAQRHAQSRQLAGNLPPGSQPKQAAEARSCTAACQITPRSTLTAARMAGTLLPDSLPEQAAEAGLCALNARNRKPGRARQCVRSRPGTRLTACPNRQRKPACLLRLPGEGSQVAPAACQIIPRKPLTAASWQVFSRLAANSRKESHVQMVKMSAVRQEVNPCIP